MEIQGFKAFNKGFTNNHGVIFEEGKIYHANGIIRYGKKENGGNGFHMCLDLANTLKFFDKNSVDIAIAKGYGQIDECDSDYEIDYVGYFNMYAVEYLKIEKCLTRKEIIDYMLTLKDEVQKLRFIRDYNLTEEEQKLFIISENTRKNFRY